MSRLTVDLSKEISDRLTEIARKEGITKAEAMRRAFALLSVAEQEKAKGNSLGIVREDPQSHQLQAIGRVVGI
ncbi:CopG family transcriptional regulator [Halomonas sp. Bachu 37]|uniref:ribbon-helix-helix domain-containing protein n=1 Tax=Halomonas kashgarensis TaxID=3084920 RepID=UPI0032173C71